MAMRQLSRIVLAAEGSSADAQTAARDGEGGYGELMDELDRIVADGPSDDPPSSTSGR